MEHQNKRLKGLFQKLELILKKKEQGCRESSSQSGICEEELKVNVIKIHFKNFSKN